MHKSGEEGEDERGGGRGEKGVHTEGKRFLYHNHTNELMNLFKLKNGIKVGGGELNMERGKGIHVSHTDKYT